MLGLEVEGYWDIVITSLQDICNANESISFDDIYNKYLTEDLDEISDEELERIREEVKDHALNIGTAKRLIDTSEKKLQELIVHLQKNAKAAANSPVKSSSTNQSGKLNKSGSSKNTKKVGRLFFTSKFNPLDPIVIGSEVAFKLKNRHFEEWIQCEVTKINGDGSKFEIRDPEPDENNNPGQTFKATYKEILLIPKVGEPLTAYPYGTKVLARYPETTTFYPAIVSGNKKDGNVKLRFDGEEEVNKETEVERRLVLPFPDKSNS